jgi:hypothetical protein
MSLMGLTKLIMIELGWDRMLNDKKEKKRKERPLGRLSVEFRRRKLNNWWWTLLNGKLFYSTREMIIVEKRIIEFIIKKYEYEWNYPLEFIG